MSQTLQGLVYLHEQGVIHRDIKGANILTTKDGTVKLADFGVATKSNVSEYSVVGTPYWMAPEVIELSGATTASDIWSLGCTVIELLDGQPPYHNLQPMPALFKIVSDDHPPLPEGASPAVRDFLMQCFQKDPNLRVTAEKLLKHSWLANARKTDSILSGQPTKYDEAVKSVQQWNEALKSPEPDSIRRSRPTSLSPMPTRKELTQSRWNNPAPNKPSNLSNARTNTDAFRSPEIDSNTIWDDDFPAPINPSALQLSHLKPRDNFGGLLSMENLKSIATNVENSSYTDGDGNRRTHSGKLIEYDPHQTVKATPGKSKQEKQTMPIKSSHRIRVQPIKDNLSNKPYKAKSQIKIRPSSAFREDTVEDYSDLLDSTADNDAFLKKLEALKVQDPKPPSLIPQLTHPSDSKHAPKPVSYAQKSNSLRRFPSGDQVVTPGLTRTKSSVEIHKYTEDENEDPEAFLEKGLVLALHGSDSGSERGTLLMSASKMSAHSIEEEEEYDDPFAQLEEEFDQMDLEANVARDRHARLCTMVEALVCDLQLAESEVVLDDLTEQLIQVLSEFPELKSVIISSHGILPILEILEGCADKEIIWRLLKIINLVVYENVEMLKNLCFVGGIPIVSEFALKQFSSEIRHEAAAFVKQICETSTLALQMFVSCGGLNVLVGFLEEDMETERDLVLIGVNGICSVFELQGPTPKNDFCRILSRSSILYPLSLVLDKLITERTPLAEEIIGRIVNIFLPFSQAENYVKETVADRMVLKRILGNLRRMMPTHQAAMLKFIKNLSMLSTTHEALQNSNAIEVLTDLLRESMELAQHREVPNNVLHILFNLCRLNKMRQEDAALSGLIPLLQKVIKTNKPFKELALPILCDMAHCGYVGRRELWQYQGLQFYISLLSDKYWQVTALDAIFVWYVDQLDFYLNANDSVGYRKKLPKSNKFWSKEVSAKQLLNVSTMLKLLLMPLKTCLTLYRNYSF
jgi:serine/threonine protein kinase